MAKKASKKSTTSQPATLKKIAEALVKKAETDSEIKDSLIEQTASIVKHDNEFKAELVKAVLSNKKIKSDALKEIIDELLD